MEKYDKTFSDLSVYSTSELQVVEYILAHMEDVSRMNIAELAQKTYSSNGMIIRIAKKAGCEGFRELKMKLTQELERVRYLQNDVDFSFPFEVGESTNGIIANMAALYRSTINYIQPSLHPGQLNRIVRWLLQARHIFLFATGDCELIADSFENKLKKLHIYASLGTRHGDQASVAEGMTKKDIGIFISYSGETNVVNSSLYPLKRNGIPIVAITANKESLLSKIADETILISMMEGARGQKISNFYSTIAFEYILNIIFSLMYNEVHRKDAGQ